MYASTCLSDSVGSGPEPKLNRVDASAKVALKFSHDRTCLDQLYQTGAAKIRLPKTYSDFSEAVLINTAGGLTGGDRVNWSISLEDHTKAVVTTQASEKAYEASFGVAKVQTTINVGADAICHWLPQETILYEKSALDRTLDVNLDESASLIALETIMLGRQAMGEALDTCFFKDKWRIRKGGKLIFADDIKISDGLSDIKREKALLQGQKCFATLIYTGTEDDEQLAKLADQIKPLLIDQLAGISTFGGKILIRLLAEDSYKMRQIIIPILTGLSGNDLPKVWRI